MYIDTERIARAEEARRSNEKRWRSVRVLDGCFDLRLVHERMRESGTFRDRQIALRIARGRPLTPTQFYRLRSNYA